MQAIALEVILRAVLGAEDQRQLEQLASPLRRLLDATGSRLRLVLLQATSSERGPRSPWGRFRALMEPGDRVIMEQIAARRSAPERDDVLSLLLAARDEDGQPLTDAELRDELMTLLVAGYETTATALSCLAEPMELGGRTFPAGVNIAPSVYLLHRRPDLYPEPERFRPERFLERTAGHLRVNPVPAAGSGGAWEQASPSSR
jgi:cytochrome P450 family 135